MRFSTPNTVPSEVVMPMAVLPSLMASREYSTWKRRPSGEKVLIPRSAPHQPYMTCPDSRADLPYSERAMNMVSDFGRLFQAQKNFSRGMRLRVATRRRGGGGGQVGRRRADGEGRYNKCSIPLDRQSSSTHAAGPPALAETPNWNAPAADRGVEGSTSKAARRVSKQIKHDGDGMRHVYPLVPTRQCA